MKPLEFIPILFVIFCFSKSGAVHCPAGLPKDSDIINNGSKCYEFVLHHRNDWAFASGYCAKFGGNLVTIEDMDEQTFIQDSLRHLRFTGKGVWIGLNDRRKEGQFEWIEGNEPANFTYWSSGQPGNFLNLNEDCVLLMYHRSGHWHDYHCFDEFLSIPEHDGWICQYGTQEIVMSQSTTSGTTEMDRLTTKQTQSVSSKMVGTTVSTSMEATSSIKNSNGVTTVTASPTTSPTDRLTKIIHSVATTKATTTLDTSHIIG